MVPLVSIPEDEPEGTRDAVEARPDWREPAHPSARLVHDEVRDAFVRQIAHLDSLDTKGSFVVAGVVAALAAGLLLGHFPLGPHAQDLAAISLLLLLVALVAGCFTWWPRQVGDVPNPEYVRTRWWNAVEEVALRDITDQRVIQYQKNLEVEKRKAHGLHTAIICLPAGIIAGFAAIILNGH
jgi:hypothetical protein